MEYVIMTAIALFVSGCMSYFITKIFGLPGPVGKTGPKGNKGDRGSQGDMPIFNTVHLRDDEVQELKNRMLRLP